MCASLQNTLKCMYESHSNSPCPSSHYPSSNNFLYEYSNPLYIYYISNESCLLYIYIYICITVKLIVSFIVDILVIVKEISKLLACWCMYVESTRKECRD